MYIYTCFLCMYVHMPKITTTIHKVRQRQSERDRERERERKRERERDRQRQTHTEREQTRMATKLNTIPAVDLQDLPALSIPKLQR